MVENEEKTYQIKKKIKKIANSNSPVMVTGETGTGKELVVQSIHNYSERCNKPFIAQTALLFLLHCWKVYSLVLP